MTRNAKITAKALGEHRHYKASIVRAQQFALENDCTLHLADAPYQVAKIIGEGVKLVIYPHKNSNGYKHLRIRNEGSKDRARAQALMRASGFGIHNG